MDAGLVANHEERVLLHDAVMNLNLEKRVQDPRFQRILHTDPTFIKQLKFLYKALVESHIDFKDLIKTQRFANQLNEFELHYLIVKAALQECEEKLKEALAYKPKTLVNSNLLKNKPDLLSRVIDFQTNKKSALERLEQKFLRRLKREDEFDAGKIKFRIPEPEQMTKAYPYFSYKKNRFKVLKSANLGYVQKYVANGENLAYAGLGKLEAKEKKEQERERQEIIAMALEKKKEKDNFQTISSNTNKLTVKQLNRDMPEETWLEEQLKQFEEEKEKKRLREKWGSATNCIAFLNKNRRALKFDKFKRPNEKKGGLIVSRRPSSASSKPSKFALISQKNDDTISLASSIHEKDQDENKKDHQETSEIATRITTPKVRESLRESEKQDFKRQKTIAEAEDAKETEELQEITDASTLIKMREIRSRSMDRNPLDDDTQPNISEFNKTAISDFSKSITTDFARTDGFQKIHKTQNLFPIKEKDDVPSKFEEEFNKILGLDHQIELQESAPSSGRKRGLDNRIDESIQLGSDSDSPRNKTPGSVFTRSSFPRKYRPSTVSDAARRYSTGTTWMKSGFALKSELFDISIDKMSLLEDKVKVGNFLTEMQTIQYENLRNNKRLSVEAIKQEERLGTLATTLDYCRELSYAVPCTMQSLYQYHKGDEKFRQEEQKKAIFQFHEDQKGLELKVVRFKTEALKGQLRNILERKRILRFDKTYN